MNCLGVITDIDAIQERVRQIPVVEPKKCNLCHPHRKGSFQVCAAHRESYLGIPADQPKLIEDPV